MPLRESSRRSTSGAAIDYLVAPLLFQLDAKQTWTCSAALSLVERRRVCLRRRQGILMDHLSLAEAVHDEESRKNAQEIGWCRSQTHVARSLPNSGCVVMNIMMSTLHMLFVEA